MRRWTIRICVLVFLGAMVNIAVAWGFAMFLNLHALRTASRAGGMSEPGAGFWYVSRSSTTGAMYVRSSWPNTVSYAGPITSAETVAGSWVSLFKSPKYVGESVTVDARGWPALGMFSIEHRHDVWNHAKRSADLHYDVDYGIALNDWPIPAGYGGIRNLRVLPLRPHWPGFALNTALYTAAVCVIWLIFAMPFALRQWRRNKRGLCSNCGYDLRGSTSDACPECGAPSPRPSPSPMR